MDYLKMLEAEANEALSRSVQIPKSLDTRTFIR